MLNFAGSCQRCSRPWWRRQKRLWNCCVLTCTCFTTKAEQLVAAIGGSNRGLQLLEPVAVRVEPLVAGMLDRGDQAQGFGPETAARNPERVPPAARIKAGKPRPALPRRAHHHIGQGRGGCGGDGSMPAAAAEAGKRQGDSEPPAFTSFAL